MRYLGGRKMYIYNKKVLYSDTDANSKMSIEGIMNAIQDCININSESIGKGINYMHMTKKAWFAISWNIEVKRFPKLFDELEVKTWAYNFTTSMGYRNVLITDKNGEDIVCADSFWSMVDIATGRPVRIEESDTEGYELRERYPMESLSRKIKLPENFTDADIVQVRRAYIDFNGHMGNAKYIQLADEYIPEGSTVKRIRVEYKNQSRYGEKLLFATATEATDKGSRIVVKIAGEDNKEIKAVVEYLI